METLRRRGQGIMTPAPVVSIVLPVYNAGAVLSQALASIFRQTFREWELILIDDGSTDGCMAGFSVPDARVRVVQDGRNEGLAARLNQGIDLARGRYLARMDPDDIAYPGRMEAQVKFLEEHPDIDLVATRALLFRNDGSVIGLFPFRQTHDEICAAPWRGFFLPHPTWMGKMEWFRRYRYRIPEIVRAEDQELLLRSYRTSRFACLPEVLLGYRQPGLFLNKVLTARKHLALAQWSVNLEQGYPGHAILGFLAYALKALVDAALGAAGAQHLFVGRQARGAPQEEIDRWSKVWKEVQPCSRGTAPSQRGVARMALKKICLVTTSPLIVNFFLVPYLRHLREIGEVHLALDTSGNVPLKETSGAITYSIPIRRQIAPWHDLLTLIQLTRHFARNQFDIVHSFGPKAGLLTALAGWVARIPLRLHTFTGQVWITRKGVMRRILRAADKIVATLNTHILADSSSQRDILVEEGIVRSEKCKVLASGSVNGVDTSRFRPDPVVRGELRAALGIPLNAVAFLFLGRLIQDKGVLDLARAFDSARLESGYLVFVGPDEDGLQHGIERLCGSGRPRLRFAGYTPAPERYLAAADVLCLPSYREGFGSTIIEGAAAGIPALGSRIYGITDAIIDGRTGLLHAPGAIEEIAACLRRLANDDALRYALGNAARQRALSEFTQDRVMSAVLAFYRGLLDV